MLNKFFEKYFLNQKKFIIFLVFFNCFRDYNKA